jgi:hypothetical protein
MANASDLIADLMAGALALVIVAIVLVTMAEFTLAAFSNGSTYAKAIAVGYDIFWLFIGSSYLLSATDRGSPDDED